MQCRCPELDDCVSYGESEQDFCRGFTFLAERSLFRLYRCDRCQTSWQIDIDGRSDLAIKVPRPEQWSTFNDLPYRRGFFVRLHGGESDQECIWAKCSQPSLLGMAICVDHAYPEFSGEAEDL